MKSTLFPLFAICLQFVATGQSSSKRHFSIDVNCGISASYLTHKPDPGASSSYYTAGPTNPKPFRQPQFPKDSRIGLTGGIGVAYHFNNRLSLRSGVQFEAKGKDYENRITWDSTLYGFSRTGEKSLTSSIHNNYLVIPLTGRFNLFNNYGFFVELGGYGAWLTYSHFRKKEYLFSQSISSVLIAESDFNYSDQSKDKTKHWDFGLLGGLGYEQKLSSHWSVSGAVQASFGLTQIDPYHHKYYDPPMVIHHEGYYEIINTKSYYGHNYTAKNILTAIRISVGYQFGG